MIAPAVHLESKTRSSDAIKERVVRAVARAARGVTRLLPILWHHRVIGWCGWSTREAAAVVLHHRPWMQTWVDRNGLLCGFADVDDLIAKITAGNLRQLRWFKQDSGTTVTQEMWAHLYAVGGWPTAGTWSGTAFTARQHDDTETGVIMHGGDVSPATKHLISGHVRVLDQAAVTEVHVACLYDMVTTYDQCTVLAASTPFVNTLPALRYVGAGDPGLSIMGCGYTSQTAGESYTSIKYTSIGGASGQVVPGPATLQQPYCAETPDAYCPASSCFGYSNNSNTWGLLSLPLVSGDTGVTQLDSIQMSGTATDQNNYILGYQLAWLPFQGTDNTHAYDFVKQAPALPQIRDGAALTLALLINGIATYWQAGFNVAWG